MACLRRSSYTEAQSAGRGIHGIEQEGTLLAASPILPVASGASRTRTGDLLGAIQALSQLSYSPERTEV
jgi:hypothetical protein